MHLTLRQLQCFAAVASNLSYTKAAQALHLTQPAVSMQIRQLEQAAGLALTEQLGSDDSMIRRCSTVEEAVAYVSSSLD